MIYTPTRPIKFMTSSPTVEMKVTPILGTMVTTNLKTLVSSTAMASRENVVTTSHSRVPVRITMTQLVMRSTVEIKYVDYKPEQTPTHPTAQGDQDWQVSVIVVCALLVGMIVFVAIMLIKSNRRNRLVRNRLHKVIFLAPMPFMKNT